MVSMKDVAKRCEVSVATVSKALNDHHDIGEATKERIRNLAEEMGYYPNAVARALKTNRTYNIGVLFVDEANSGLTHEYFSVVLEGFKVQAESQGYDITFINSNVGKTNITYYEHCRQRNVDGVVIACVDFSKKDVIDLLKSDIPIVTIDHMCNDCTSVISENVGGMESLVSYVYEKGHRKIAYIHGQDDSSVTKARLASYYRTLEYYGIKVPENYIKTADYLETKQAAKRTKELLDLEEPPTCILYPDDTALIGGMNVIQKKGLRIPEDISIAGYDGTKMSQLLRPRLTTVRQHAGTIGKQAAKKLINIIENPKTAIVEQIIVNGSILPGESVGEV